MKKLESGNAKLIKETEDLSFIKVTRCELPDKIIIYEKETNKQIAEITSIKDKYSVYIIDRSILGKNEFNSIIDFIEEYDGKE